MKEKVVNKIKGVKITTRNLSNHLTYGLFFLLYTHKKESTKETTKMTTYIKPTKCNKFIQKHQLKQLKTQSILNKM